MVTFITINNTVMVDDTPNVIEYITTNPLNLEWTMTITVKQGEEDSEPSFTASLDSSKTKISGDELDYTPEEEAQEEEMKEAKEELLGMSEEDLELGIMLITNNAPLRNSPSPTVELEDEDFETQNAEELNHVDVEFNNIALTELEGANDLDSQAKKEDKADNADVDWLVAVIDRAA